METDKATACVKIYTVLHFQAVLLHTINVFVLKESTKNKPKKMATQKQRGFF